MKPEPGHGISSAGVITPLIDVFLCSLMIIFLFHPVFGVKEEQLPSLRPSSKDARMSQSAPARHQIVLRGDGSLLWQGKPAAREDLARMVKAQTKGAEVIQLVVEINQGLGPVEALLQLQMDLSRNQIWDRIRVMHRSPAPTPVSAEGHADRSPGR